MTKKRTLKQWIMRYVFIVAVISVIATAAISSANAAYRANVAGMDTARVALWKFSLNDNPISSFDSTPIDLLKDSNYKNVSSYQNGSKNNNTVLVPGMSGSIDYILKNESEVNAVLTKFGVKMNIKVNNPGTIESLWTEVEWKKWLLSMPVNWYITVLDKNSDGIVTNTIAIPVEGALNDLQVINTGSSIDISSNWEIVAESSTGLAFNMGDSLKVIKINWEWPFDRHDAKMYFNETSTAEGIDKTLSYDEYVDTFGTDGVISEPSFTYKVGDSTVTKMYSDFSFDDYVNLHNYCASQTGDGEEGYKQIYKYLNYTEYLKWENNLKVPNDYMTEINDIHERQSLYLDEIDSNFSKLKVDIEFLLSFKVEQAVPTVSND